MKNYLLSLLFICFISCGTGRITSLETKPTEAIVFGKMIINNNNENYKIRLHFNERLWGKNSVVLDKEGYFYMKLPLGYNFLALVESFGKNVYSKNILDNYISLNLENNDTIYYIGDIKMDFETDEQDKEYNIGGVLGAVQKSKKEGIKPNIIVTESEETINYFKQLFSNHTPVIKYKHLNIEN